MTPYVAGARPELTPEVVKNTDEIINRKKAKFNEK